MRQQFTISGTAIVAAINYEVKKKPFVTLTLMVNHYDAKGNSTGNSVLYMNAFDTAYNYLCNAVHVGDTIILKDVSFANIEGKDGERKQFVTANYGNQVHLIPKGAVDTIAQRKRLANEYHAQQMNGSYHANHSNPPDSAYNDYDYGSNMNSDYDYDNY